MRALPMPWRWRSGATAIGPSAVPVAGLAVDFDRREGGLADDLAVLLGDQRNGKGAGAAERGHDEGSVWRL